MAGTGTLAPFVKAQYFTNAGVPAAGYQMFVYLAGTSTKTNTYTDVGLTVANSNPVILDSAGRCVMFLTPGISVKLVFTTPGDSDPPLAPVWSQDNISSIPISADELDITGTAGETLAAGDGVALSDGSGGLTAGRWYKWDADFTYLSTTANALGMMPAALATGVSGSIRIVGRVSGLSSLTPGVLYYVSATAGGLTSTPPTNARAVAVADSTTSVILSQFIPTPPASATVSGIVTTGTQTLAGDKTFTGTSLFSGRLKVTPWSPLANDFTDHATSGTGATDVWTISVPANTIADGECFHAEAYGDQTGDTNAKTYTFTLGATSITPASGATGNFTSYKMHLTLERVSASVQRVYANLEQGGVGFTSTYAAWTENLGNTLTLKITLTHATAGTTTQRRVRTWIQPAF